MCIFRPMSYAKTVRNCFGEKKILVDKDGNQVNWDYVKCLHDFQEKEEIHLANKLRVGHITWMKKKMNVKLAAQHLSKSVATSLEYCLEEKIHGFEGFEATINFIRIFNTLFHSRNLNAKSFKCLIQDKNNNIIQDFLVSRSIC